MIGSVGNADFFAFRVDVSVASDLVAESVAVIGGRLSGVGITVAGLAQLVLGMVLASGVRWITVLVGGRVDCGADSGVGKVSRVSAETVSVVEELGISGHSQDQEASNLI